MKRSAFAVGLGRWNDAILRGRYRAPEAHSCGATEAGSGLAITPDGRYDLGVPSDSSLAAYRVGRKTVTVDKLPGNRRVSGLLVEFLKENAEMPDASSTR